MIVNQPSSVLIIGAGLSGLTLGRLLTNAGISNIVFEASPPERRQGFSITLRGWGYEALLSALGDVPLSTLRKGVASDRLIGGAGWLEHARLNNSTGEVLIAQDSNPVAAFRANRNALRQWISDCGEEGMDIRYNHRLKSFQSKPSGVHVEFENGARFSGSLLVAADGVHSTGKSMVALECASVSYADRLQFGSKFSRTSTLKSCPPWSTTVSSQSHATSSPGRLRH